jgi:carboxypeptidase Taq
MSETLELLRARLAEIADLGYIGQLASWDQQVMMPQAGGPARAHQVALLGRIAHERGTADEVGAWLEELESDSAALGEIDRDIVRIARRDWDHGRRVPADLVAARAHASSAGQDIWQRARAENDFAAFVPALRRNVELAREYAACFEHGGQPYDALLADYDFGMSAARVQSIFAQLTEALPPLVAQGAQRPAPAPLEVPVAAQEAAVAAVLARLGVEPAGWRVDVAAHPFSTEVGAGDSRITTRYEDGQLESVIAAMHEFGHALYERQIAPELSRTNLGGGTSLSIHESQSKLWENHVGRSLAFDTVIAAELSGAGAPLDAASVHAALVAVRPSLIRVAADQLTYPLHIVLRFELELALIDGTLDAADLPAAFNDGMQRLLGIEVPDDAHGCLQDVHWALGIFGYFPP